MDGLTGVVQLYNKEVNWYTLHARWTPKRR